MYKNYNKICGKKLKKIRESRNYSLLEVGELIGKAKSTMSQYENGKRGCDVPTLAQLMEVYKYSLSYFIEEVIRECRKQD